MPLDVYDRITARIVQQLELGTVPWRKPWTTGEGGLPRNLSSGHQYRGINVFLLGCAPHESPFWLTFRQALNLGGSVRKGAKSTPVIFWKWLEKEDKASGEVAKFPLLRHYNVFNVEQCDLPPDKMPTLAAPVGSREFEAIEACERVVSEMQSAPCIEFGGGSASYRPATDSVQMPLRERFNSPAGFYATLFHELTHATGHRSRLNRPEVMDDIRFGSDSYSREELVAEMGAAFLCGHCGIEQSVIENSTAYIAGWLKRLRDDKRLVIHAAAAAQKAADFILAAPAKTAVDQQQQRPSSSGPLSRRNLCLSL